MERWDILDSKGNKTGETTLEGNKLANNEYSLFVHVWIVNSKGEILIQKRADHLKNVPGLWAITGGAVISGEDSITAARRETKEELGIDINPNRKPFRHKRRNAFTDIWLAISDVKLEDLTLQEKEVSDVMWVSKEKLKKMINTGKFHKYDDKYFDLVQKLGI